MVMTVNDLEELAEKSWGSGLKGRVEHREKVLDRTLEAIRVLETQGGKRSVPKLTDFMTFGWNTEIDLLREMP